MGTRSWRCAVVSTLASLVAMLATTSMAAAIEIAGNGLSQTSACADQNVALAGSRNTLTLTGACPKVDITGANNTLRVEALGAVEITGSATTVTWERSLVGDRPRVSETGFGNRVERASEVPAPTPTPEPEAEPVEEVPPIDVVSPVGPVHLLVQSGFDRSLDCADNGIVNLVGSNNRLTLTGTCLQVNILGASNQVWVQRVGAIDIAGQSNVVTWESGVDDAGTPPSIAIIGADSSAEQGPMP